MEAPAVGVVSLRAPIPPSAVADLVESFLDAWKSESLDGLSTFLTADAGPLEARNAGRAALTDAWRQRLQGHAYPRLIGMDLVRRERIAYYPPEALDRPGAPAKPAGMKGDELYVRVPLETTHVSGERLFGDTLILLIRREEGQLRIAAYAETDDVPPSSK